MGIGNREMVLKGVSSLFIKSFSALSGFLTVFLLVKVLGEENFGIYSYLFAISTVLVMLSQFGLPILLVREVASLKQRENWGGIRSVWCWSNWIATMLAIIIMTIFLLVCYFFEFQMVSFSFPVVLIVSVLMPVMVHINLRGAMLRGLGYSIIGQVPEFMLRPIFFLIFLYVYWAFFSGDLTVVTVIEVHIVAAMLTLSVSLILLRKTYHLRVPTGNRERLKYGKLSISLLPLVITNSMVMVNQQADIIILGWYNISDVAVYRVVVSIAVLVAFGLQSITFFLSPYFSKIYASGDLFLLGNIVRKASLLIFIIGVVVFILVFLLGEPALRVLFGDAFSRGYYPLVILAIGHLFSSLVGCSSVLLNMTGNEKKSAKGAAVSAILNIFLNIMLIPTYGMIGAAVATVSSTILWMCIMWFYSKSILGINCLPFNVKEYRC